MTLGGRLTHDVGEFTLELPLPGSRTDVQLASDLLLDGGGTMVLGTGTMLLNDLSSATPRLTVGPQYMIRGGGLLGKARIKLTNNGTILADLPAEPLVLDVVEGVNDGVIEVTVGATAIVKDQFAQSRTGWLFDGNGEWRAEGGKLDLYDSVGISTTKSLPVRSGGRLALEKAVVQTPMVVVEGASAGGARRHLWWELEPSKDI